MPAAERHAGSYYRRLRGDGDRAVFESTDHTRSNWTRDIQHGSPPLALLTKVVEEALGPGMRITRLVFDILGPVPVAEVAACARVARPGRRICLLEADMAATGQDRTVARLSAWAMATCDTAEVATDRYPPLTEGETSDGIGVTNAEIFDTVGFVGTSAQALLVQRR